MQEHSDDNNRTTEDDALLEMQVVGVHVFLLALWTDPTVRQRWHREDVSRVLGARVEDLPDALAGAALDDGIHDPVGCIQAHAGGAVELRAL